MRISRPTLLSLASAAVALAVAAWVRSLNRDGVFVGGDVILWEVDPFYHVRRIWLTVLHFPHVPRFDPYLCFPEGAVCPWPPGFDFALASLVLALTGGTAGLLDVKIISAWAIPWLGGISCAWVAWIAARAWGPLSGLAAGLALAFLPVQIEMGLIGRVDHHVVESLSFAILAGRFLRGAEASGRGALVTGLVLALSHLFWTGTPIFGVVMAGAGIALGLIDPSTSPRPEAARDVARALAWGAAVLVPLVLLFPPDPRTRLTFEMLSWFHPLFLAALALGVGATSRIFSLRGRARGRALLGAGFLALIALGLLYGPAAPTLRGALAFLLRTDPLNATTGEGVPLSLAGVWGAFSWIGVACVPAVAALALRMARGHACPEEARLAAWTLASLGAWLLMPGRLAAHAAVSLSLLFGWAVGACLAADRAARGGPRRALAVSAAAALAASILLCAEGLQPTRIVNGTGMYAEAEEALEWLRIHTEPTMGFDDPAAHPQYAVLSDWGRGHWIVMIAERPAVGSPLLLLPWFVAAARDGSDYGFAEDESAALAIASRRRARYIVTSPINALSSLATSSGRDPARYFLNREGRPHFPAFFRTMNTRLLLLDGRSARLPDGTSVPALTGHRLRFESRRRADWSSVSTTPIPGTIGTQFSLVKVYEVVPGGRVEGRAPAGAVVRATVRVRTNLGRTFEWETATTADTRGRFRLRVPYPNAPATAFSTGTEGPTRIHGWGREAEVRFTEEEIKRGTARGVDLRARPRASGKIPTHAEHAPGRSRGERVGERAHRAGGHHRDQLETAVLLRPRGEDRGAPRGEQGAHVREIHARAQQDRDVPEIAHHRILRAPGS